MHGFVPFLVLVDAHESVFCYKLPAGAEGSEEKKHIFLEDHVGFPLAEADGIPGPQGVPQAQFFKASSLRIFQSATFLCGLSRNGRLQLLPERAELGWHCLLHIMGETQHSNVCAPRSCLFVIEKQSHSASWRTFNGSIYGLISSNGSVVFLKEIGSKQPENLELEEL